MPELPEVETVRRTLAPLLGARVRSVRTSGLALRLGRPVDRAGLEAAATRATVEAVRRIGKYLLIDFARRDRGILVHLGMSGRLRLFAAGADPVPHTHVELALEGGGSLRYSDPRRFGQVDTFARGAEREHPALAVLGPDPLTDGVSGERLYQHARGKKRGLKALLLDQGVLAGIGNIYASEALWHARLRPSRASARLSRPGAERLAASVREVLDRALDHGGTSLRDFVAADGHAGEHAHYLWVYDREGEACVRRGCHGRILRTVLQGRSTFHCPRCQK